MADETKQSQQEVAENPQAADHVEEARQRLISMRGQLDKHPDLEAAIERLEMALSILTTKTGGML
jgi:hypothetical protein